MAEAKGQAVERERKYIGLFFSIKNHAIEFYTRKKKKIIYLKGKIYDITSPLIVVFAFLYSLTRSCFLWIKHGVHSLISVIRSILYFEYKLFLCLIVVRLKDYSIKAKVKTYQFLWIPIRKRTIRLKKQARRRLLDVQIYFRGFIELCRRLFLLLSDYTPGGQWTVGCLLLLFSIFTGIEMFRYSRLVFNLFNFVSSALMFLLSPLLWTLRDVWAVIAIVLNVLLSLLQYTWLLVVLFFREVANFVLKVLTAFIIVIYKMLAFLVELKCVQYIWKVFLELVLKTIEVFIFKILPVLIFVLSHFVSLSSIASRYFYEYCIVVRANEEQDHEYFSNTRISATVFTLICLILAYTLRDKFHAELCSEIEEKSSTSGVISRRVERLKSARHFRAGKRDETAGNEDEVYFQLSSSAQICTGFLQGECKRGRRCEGHHCPWPYHWQYRVPVQGWKSFSTAESDVLEKLYCNPTNEITRTRDIDPDLSAVTRRSHVKSDTPIRLDFQQMRMEVNYYRSDLRRLSTESYVKKQSDDLSTRWIWYRLDDQGEWIEYENEESSVPKQEAIEASYIRRESSYNYKKQAQDYRIYFFMTPMYERNMNPREYKRRLVRRRPEYRPIEEYS